MTQTDIGMICLLFATIHIHMLITTYWILQDLNKPKE